MLLNLKIINFYLYFYYVIYSLQHHIFGPLNVNFVRYLKLNNNTMIIEDFNLIFIVIRIYRILFFILILH